MSKRIFTLDCVDILNQNTVHQLHEELRDDGYVYVSVSDDITAMIAELTSASKRFFDMPVVEKIRYSYSLGINERNKYRASKMRQRQSLFHRFMNSLECMSCIPSKRVIGSSGSSSSGQQQRGKCDPNPREYFDMTAAVNRFCDVDFETTLKKGLLLFNQLAEKYLELILAPLNVDMNYVRSVTKLGTDSLTTLRLLKYYYHGDSQKETCLRHTDRGLITLAYCQQSGLTVKDFHTHQWVDVEAAAPSKPCMILFVGETLSRLTGGYFKAILHKVVSREDRFSFPFFFRGRTPAMLDIALMKSQVLNDMLAAGKLERLPPITVGDLDKITTTQYFSNSIPLELGEFKKDPYYVFADEVVEVVN